MLRFTPLALALLSLCGCAPAAPATYVGPVDSSQARIAVYTEGNTLTAYVCGGASDYQTLTGWFLPPATLPAQGSLDLTGDGLALHLQRSGAGFDGTVTDRLGATHNFHATLLAGGTLAGLYQTVDEGCRTGVIVSQDNPSTDPSVQGVWCSNAGAREQVTPVLPLALRDGSLLVRTNVQSVLRELSVTRVQFPLN